MDDHRVVFNQFDLVVRDMEATVAFYRRLGAVVEDTLPEWQEHHRHVEMPDGLVLHLDSEAFTRDWNRGWRGTTGILGFRVASRDDVDRIYHDLVGAGYTSQQEPYDAFFGARYAVVEDPGGNAVGLMSPVDPSRRRPVSPPQS